MCCGDKVAAAISFVTRSSATTVINVPQKRGGLALALSIFFALLALDAISGVRQRVETLETDLSSAIVALAELLWIAIEAAKRLVDVPQKAAFLAREQKRRFAFHCVSALMGHGEGVCAQIPVRSLRGPSESLIVVPQLLQDALPLFEQALLKMLEVFFRHRLRFGGIRLFAASCCCHFLTNPLQGDFNALSIKVERMRRVCSFFFLAHIDCPGEYFIRDPFLKRVH